MEGERLAKLETKLEEHCKFQEISDKKNDEAHFRIENKIDSYSAKVDTAMKEKADKSDLVTLDNRFWGVVMAIIIAFIGIIVTAVKSWNGN